MNIQKAYHVVDGLKYINYLSLKRIVIMNRVTHILCLCLATITFLSSIAMAADSGAVVWKADRPAPRHRYAWLTPTLVVSDGVVLSADRLADRPVDTGGKDPTAVEWRVSANHILTDGLLVALPEADAKKLNAAIIGEIVSDHPSKIVVG